MINEVDIFNQNYEEENEKEEKEDGDQDQKKPSYRQNKTLFHNINPARKAVDNLALSNMPGALMYFLPKTMGMLSSL